MRIPEVRLSDGNRMPLLGLGTWQMQGATCVNAVRKALDMGYTHIDTADIYGNHREVGKAISGHERSELSITSKVWRTDLAYKDVLRACDRALREIGTDYLDLYLIHYPNDRFPIEETLKAFKRLVEDEKIRSAGLSNFYDERLSSALEGFEIPLVTNQVEFHPYLYQKGLLDFCKKNDVVVTAYSPLARGAVLDDPVISGIAERHGKSTAQVSLRWLLQHGMTAIPKSSSEKHLRENMDIFAWELTRKEMGDIDSLKLHDRFVNPSFIEMPLLDMMPKGVLKRIPDSVRKRFGRQILNKG
jgi:2,5-diketo-D-gluconate reductase B